MCSTKSLLLLLVWLCFAHEIALTQPPHAVRELKLTASCGVSGLSVEAENAIRVRCDSSADSQEPELIFIAPPQNVAASVGSDASSSWLQTSQIKAVVDKIFTLYDNDGSTYRYEQGQSSKISIAWNEKTETLL